MTAPDPMVPKTFEESLHALGSNDAGIILKFFPDDPGDHPGDGHGQVALGIHNMTPEAALDMLQAAADSLREDMSVDLTTFLDGVAQ